MATIKIDFDSKGDVELIFQEQEQDHDESQEDVVQQMPSSQIKPTNFGLGSIEVNVKEIHLRISSLKLISSSRYFQAMLQGFGFPEGEELREKGHCAIVLTVPRQ
jgi:hypothetical protein